MKKKAFIFGFSVFCAVVLAFSMCISSLTTTVSALDAPLKIVLDAGHGGIDGGVVGKITKVKESDVNLAIVMLLKTRLEEAGFDVVLTRKTEAGLYGFATKGFKKRDMQKRKEIIEEAKPFVMVSVHQNFYPTSSSRGGQMFYHEGDEDSKLLAENLQEKFNNFYVSEGARERTVAPGDYYMLKCTKYPSVIAECGFLSNAKDEALLTGAQGKRTMADILCAGILAFLSSVQGMASV